jgi:hypothetical protein
MKICMSHTAYTIGDETRIGEISFYEKREHEFNYNFDVDKKRMHV